MKPTLRLFSIPTVMAALPFTCLAPPVITTFTATPSTITFTSSDPDVGATGSATIALVFNGPANGHTWNLAVKANTSTLTNCGTVPVSAIHAACQSVSATGTGGNHPTGACASSFALSTTATIFASGTQGDGSSNSFTINVNYPFTDSWSYVGASSPACSLTLSYTATINN